MKLYLDSQVADQIAIPDSGEIWIPDAELRGFGIRAWSGKKGGGKAYALRLRDMNNKIVRENNSIERGFNAVGASASAIL